MKVAGSYESVVRGVSQQVPQDRRSGQHAEQVNMISDPVLGLARRHGSILQHEVRLAAEAAYPTVVADTANHLVLPFTVSGADYDLIYRTRASTAPSYGFVQVFDKGAGRFLPVVFSSDDAVLDDLISGGVSAAVAVGRYILLAGNTVVPSYTGTDAWEAPSNQSLGVAWVRGGAYSRTFSVTVSLNNGTSVTASYKTLSSSYPETLDTSDIPVYLPGGTTVDGEYQKKVNDRVNAYNSAVTQWIGTAAEDITPENIAQKLVDSLVTQGISASRVSGTVCIDDARLLDITGDDGGDGSLLHAVGNIVAAADLVSAVHMVGKIVKVRPSHSNGDDAYYLQASAKVPGATGFTDVVWNEAAGRVVQPDTVFAIGTLKGGTFYLAGTPDKLEGLTGDEHPHFPANVSGDAITSPLPHFFGKKISYLGMFQDRLVVGADATLMFSRPGDYFNWFRQSVLTVLDSDPWEGYALGAENDTITSSTTYDRNLILHGRRFWYEINGRQPLTPKTASISTGSAYADANTAPPVSAGNFTFYAKFSGLPGKEVCSVHQVQAGLVDASPETTEVSKQLADYLQGKPVQLAHIESPNMVFLRTSKVRNGLYVYGYLDTATADRRLLDNWSRWVWDDNVGSLVALSTYQQTLLAYVVRANASGTWIAAERFSLDAGLSDFPYVDSLRRLDSLNTGFINTGDTTAIAAFQNGISQRFLGSPLTQLGELQEAYPTLQNSLWLGYPAPAYVTPTNPYIKDRDGNPVMVGRLTLGRVAITVADTSGLTVDVTTSRSVDRVQDFSGRILGDQQAILGTQPVVSTTITAAVGKEIRECSYTINAKTWLPLTITSLEWVGQVFNNVRRI